MLSLLIGLPDTRCYNPIPDEKGTERQGVARRPDHPQGGYNHCPDEKGTESNGDNSVIPTIEQAGYNHCPDEKGTERIQLLQMQIEIFIVTTIAPMKRGLKVKTEEASERGGVGYNHFPDEKGIKRNAIIVNSKNKQTRNQVPTSRGQRCRYNRGRDAPLTVP